MASTPADDTLTVCLTAPTTVITLVLFAFNLSIQGAGLPRPAAYTGTFSSITTSICSSKNSFVNKPTLSISVGLRSVSIIFNPCSFINPLAIS